ADLKKLTEQELVTHFGKTGGFFYRIVRGIDERPVQANRQTQSVGAEDTFPYDLINIEDMHAQLDKIATTLYQRLLRHELRGRTITLKIKYRNFKQITRSYSFDQPQQEFAVIRQTAKELLATTLPAEQGIRLLGISLSNFNDRLIIINETNNSTQLIMDF
ncbi:MAG: DNA polymerase IV, partial [Chitinophagaceae bacterium]|nr:DNA polymerase IV [Chitinophagaceae bacterium]